MKGRKVAWSVILAVLMTCVFTTMVIAESAHKASGGKDRGDNKDKWVIMTYTPDNGYTVPVPMPVTKIKEDGVSFDLFINGGSPDRAMLITEKFPKGKLTGHSLSARIAIIAPPDTIFNYCGPNCLPGTDPGGFVRLYIQGVNPALVGCEAGWHPERPDCEAQYWWSNPLHIDLADLALLGKKGITLHALLSPENWSDRDGHMGDDPLFTDTSSGIKVDHTAAFNAAVKNATKMGLSFGGGDNFAFGTGASQSATFLLYDFSTKSKYENDDKHDEDKNDEDKN
jgi:hypothetical protein